MSGKVTRHPIGNFFILRKLQVGLIKKIVLSALLSTVVGLGTLAVLYFLRYKNTAFYPVSFDAQAAIGNRANIISIIAPSLVVSAIINILIGVAIGLYASRKYAVPIFKLEQWADLLIAGHLGARLNFREKEELKELSDRCNRLSESLRHRFELIHSEAEKIAKNETIVNDESVKKILAHLEQLSFKGTHIDVDTGILKIDHS